MAISKTKKSNKTLRPNKKHQSKSKAYLKTYWPYIPMLGILLAGYLLNSYLSRYNLPVSNISYSLAKNSYYNLIDSLIGVVALAIFLMRHGFALHKVWVRGEEFVNRHPLMDIGLLAIAVFGAVLAHNDVLFI